MVLNPSQNQRLMFIAAHFRKEVTATVLWLREHGIDARCFKVVPYVFGEELFVDIQPVIPTPEAADFMISMVEKESEAKSAQGAQKTSHKLRYEFWTQCLESMRARGLSRYSNISPTRDHWLSSSTGVSGCVYSLIFSRSEIRVEFSAQRPDQADNKLIYDELYAQRHQIEETFGHPLTWKRLDDKKSSRIQYDKPADSYNQDNWPDLIEWLAQHVVLLENALRGPLQRANQSLKAGEGVF